MKFTIKSLIALFVTSSALLLTPMKSDAQVNMKMLAEVAKSCQKDVFSEKYYQQMEYDAYGINQILNYDYYPDHRLHNCISSRYHYSLLLSQFTWLASEGEIIPGYPGSVAIGELAYSWSGVGSNLLLLDCLVTQDASNDVCGFTRGGIAKRYKYINSQYIATDYLPHVCPSCVVAHDDVSGSSKVILQAFIQWFLKLDKPQRREVISILGDDNKARQLRQSLRIESHTAIREYQETRKRVEQQEQERRRQELLGN
jgi:hypothetical protein